ncbi:MAG: hypothetical protein N2316_05875 [Spirochaetes bacterium]|nr:hypothetical protein [Spirochaetota bacterium]
MKRKFSHIFFLCIVTTLLFPYFAISEVHNEDVVVSSILSRFEQMLKKKGWYTQKDDFTCKAFRFESDYHEIVAQLSASRKNTLTSFEVTIIKNGNLTIKTFTFKNTSPNYADTAEKIITSHLVSLALQNNGVSPKNPHFTSLSIGYSRTNDNTDILPEKKKGGYYLALSYTYDPSQLTGLEWMRLNFGEFLTINAWAVIDTDPINRNYINENFLNFDIIILGRHCQKENTKHRYRLLYGFFTGMEYFRPGWKDNILLWNHSLYQDQPHIQYMLWRAIACRICSTYFCNYGIYTVNFMVGLGPSINSSLFAVGWDQEEELHRSPLFQSLTGSKQNYYYSTAYPISLSLAAEYLWRFNFTFSYNFYFFYASDPAIRNEKAYDIVHILKPSIGIQLTEKLLVQINWEHWHIHSMLNGKHTSHSWNRFFMETKYYF